MKKIALFDLLKTLCVFMVIILHSGWPASVEKQYLVPFGINMAVPIYMIIYGFFVTKSFINKPLHKMYEFDLILKKIIRILFPFTFIFFVGFIVLNKGYDVMTLIHTFLRGGEDFGGYYIPVMIQLILISPFIYCIIKQRNGLIMLFFINLFYEIARVAFHIGTATYRLLGFRYMFLVGCGMYLYLHYDELISYINHKKMICSMVFGALYIYLISYTNYETVIFLNWKNTSMITALWIFPIIIYACKYFDHIKDRKIFCIGRASFHMFLVQMIFIDNRSIFMHTINYQIDTLMNVLVCIPTGYIFYKLFTPLESKFTYYITKIIR